MLLCGFNAFFRFINVLPILSQHFKSVVVGQTGNKIYSRQCTEIWRQRKN